MIARRRIGLLSLLFERTADLAITLSVVVTLAFLLIPILVTALMSLDSRPFMGYFPPPGLTTKWLVSFFKQREYLQGVKTTLIVGGAAAALSTIAGVLAAMALGRYEFKGRTFITNLVMAPLTVPAVVIGYGMLGFFALVGGVSTLERLILAHVVITLPYTVRVIMATMSGIDRSLEEAATGLGANPFMTIVRVILPLIRPAVVSAAVMAFAVSIADVPVSVFLTDPVTTTLSIVLFSQLITTITPAIAAASVYLMAVTGLAVYVIDKLFGLERFLGLRTDSTST